MVEADERIATEMILNIDRAGAAAVSIDIPQAAYTPTTEIGFSVQASTGLQVVAHSVRYIVEVQRRGGIIPRALLGGEFLVSTGSASAVNILVGNPWDEAGEHVIKSELNRLRGFVPGLPADFVEGVRSGLMQDNWPLPPGVLTIDRAGYDVMESSSPIFMEAAMVLRACISAELTGHVIEHNVEAAMLKFASMVYPSGREG
ncbi:hypothetical protein [Mycobacteroides abscessus]|uniref:hypothetical protein n=1 Tax=Mycobacteroides abscessus TaxID=36809 RepID=UPI0012FFEDED|nr:hypothetical protein [Mycobacteroides abscessus]